MVTQAQATTARIVLFFIRFGAESLANSGKTGKLIDDPNIEPRSGLKTAEIAEHAGMNRLNQFCFPAQPANSGTALAG